MRLARGLKLDVILTDLRMPGMDGLTAITEPARLGITARVLVLTTYGLTTHDLTIHDNGTHVLPAIEASATGCLLKDSPRSRTLPAHRDGAGGDMTGPGLVDLRLVAHRPVGQR
ncbi:hypothetical protein GCM10018952_09900 [Streptosporangium vulgare]